MSEKKIAIFASGAGSNAEAIIQYFQKGDTASIALIVSNRKEAFVLERARKFSVESHVFNREDFYGGKVVTKMLHQYDIDFIVLAGFLWLIPLDLVNAFRGRIINIHPALLPKYGGKGMYGNHVHKAVLEAGEKESGITIHHVNEKYDEGNIIFQAKCPVEPDDTPETLASRIHQLEHQHYPKVIEQVLLDT